MRLVILTLVLGIVSALSAQQAPTVSRDSVDLSMVNWLGDTASFVVMSTGDIKLMAEPVGDSKAIFTPCTNYDSAVWTFGATMLFNPSSSNFVRVWLMADEASVDKIEQGICLEIGGTKDNFRLFSYRAGTFNLLLQGSDSRVNYSTVSFTARVSRSVVGEWQVWSKVEKDSVFVLEGSATVSEPFSNRYFGFQCIYTSTRSDKFYFNHIDLKGKPFVDIVAPEITELTVLNEHQIEMQFSEPVQFVDSLNPLLINGSKWEGEIEAVTSEKYIVTLGRAIPLEVDFEVSVTDVIDDFGNAMAAYNQVFSYVPFYVKSFSQLSDNQLCLTTSVPLLSPATFTLQIGDRVQSYHSEIVDTCTIIQIQPFENDSVITISLSQIISNRLDTISHFSNSFFWHIPRMFDLVFTEIMFDPSPSVGLPEVEYFEVYNKSEFPIFLGSLFLQVGATVIPMPDVQINSNSYLSFCSKPSLSLMEAYQPIAISSFSLPNGDGHLKLIYDTVIICQTDYCSAWQSGSFKSDGGWSLERKDVMNPEDDDNWSSSINHLGGTPGAQNSITDLVANSSIPKVENVFVYNDESLGIWFSELVDLSDIEQAAIKIDGKTKPIEAESNLTNYIVVNGISMADGEEHELIIEGFIDRYGDEMQQFISSVSSVSAPNTGDVVISEVMFEPKDSAAEFIELYNTSNVAIDLSDVVLCKPTSTDYPGKAYSLSEFPIAIAPKSYLVLTANATHFVTDYNVPNEVKLVECSSFPLLNNDEGRALLVTKSGVVIDSITYNSTWHFELLNSDKGVSLERLSSEIDGNIASNWHSAASSVGYATPGKQNSQQIKSEFSSSQITVLPEVFTPDNDGIDDVTVVSLMHQLSGTMTTISVMNSSGVVVKKLVSNSLVANQNQIVWDGTSDSGERLPTGLYLVFIEYWQMGKCSEIVKCAVVISPKG